MNADSLLVVDANIGVKWFVMEEFSAQARALVASGHELLAVDIFPAEVANAFLRKVRAGDISAADALEAITRIVGLVRLASSSPHLPEAWRIATRYDRTTYDALYVSLALANGCRLVTGDRRLFNSLHRDYAEYLAWLGDMPSGV